LHGTVTKSRHARPLDADEAEERAEAEQRPSQERRPGDAIVHPRESRAARIERLDLLVGDGGHHEAARDAQKLQFRQLTPDDGLSSSRVQSIVQDSRGFMWFGTTKGLNRLPTENGCGPCAGCWASSARGMAPRDSRAVPTRNVTRFMRARFELVMGGVVTLSD
jgi:hypothetical protein